MSADIVTGDKFKKVDLHVHTPKSMCYNDKSAQAGQIVKAAIAENLDAIAITDHNTADAIKDIRQAAETEGLSVFSGVELSTIEGHVVALYDINTPLTQLEDLLESLKIPPNKRGDGTHIVGAPIEDVFQRINEKGGLAIAAHIERWPSGFLETKTSRQTKMKIHSSKYLSALEITVSQNKDLWNRGEMRGYPKKYPCIQSSDAHAPDEIGRRCAYIQMEPVGLAELREAFDDYENRIVFP